jgi:hypothetical protein
MTATARPWTTVATIDRLLPQSVGGLRHDLAILTRKSRYLDGVLSIDRIYKQCTCLDVAL